MRYNNANTTKDCEPTKLKKELLRLLATWIVKSLRTLRTRSLRKW